MSRPEDSAESWPTLLVEGGRRHALPDPVAVEEPLEIRIVSGSGEPLPLCVTLRTPGHDGELAAGFLYGEALIGSRRDLGELSSARDPERPHESRVDVRLTSSRAPDLQRSARSFLAHSGCGICGKAVIEAVFARGFPPLPPEQPRLTPELLGALPERLRRAQPGFGRTGGLHAAGLFDASGELLCAREDVGRHNAVDKVVGAWLLADRLPASGSILAVSGRAGFEIAQKALRAGIPVLAAVGAPSSLTLRLAERAGMTVVGFLRPGRFNVYTGAQRLAPGR